MAKGKAYSANRSKLSRIKKTTNKALHLTPRTIGALSGKLFGGAGELERWAPLEKRS